MSGQFREIVLCDIIFYRFFSNSHQGSAFYVDSCKDLVHWVIGEDHCGGISEISELGVGEMAEAVDAGALDPHGL
jgi:hypothetical protein